MASRASSNQAGVSPASVSTGQSLPQIRRCGPKQSNRCADGRLDVVAPAPGCSSVSRPLTLQVTLGMRRQLLRCRAPKPPWRRHRPAWAWRHDPARWTAADGARASSVMTPSWCDRIRASNTRPSAAMAFSAGASDGCNIQSGSGRSCSMGRTPRNSGSSARRRTSLAASAAARSIQPTTPRMKLARCARCPACSRFRPASARPAPVWSHPRRSAPAAAAVRRCHRRDGWDCPASASHNRRAPDPRNADGRQRSRNRGILTQQFFALQILPQRGGNFVTIERDGLFHPLRRIQARE